VDRKHLQLINRTRPYYKNARW